MVLALTTPTFAPHLNHPPTYQPTIKIQQENRIKKPPQCLYLWFVHRRSCDDVRFVESRKQIPYLSELSRRKNKNIPPKRIRPDCTHFCWCFVNCLLLFYAKGDTIHTIRGIATITHNKLQTIQTKI